MHPVGTVDIATSAARRAESTCALPIGLIISILATVIPMLVRCFMATTDVSPEESHARAIDEYNANPDEFLKRTRRLIKRQGRKNGEKLRKHDLVSMSNACVAELMATAEPDFISYASACAAIGGSPDDDVFVASDSEDDE